ncbi:hypothetical protein Acr_24g0008960 [Actinidia rufa]|uniref:Uncharacterized protein n=1 Tax=Actinidia rufa TaxID=165716 RepID=A0A7J0GV96_9ERIC|nr:hypothetical protein Acr_24g0008960 [Actinidia rufa]
MMQIVKGKNVGNSLVESKLAFNSVRTIGLVQDAIFRYDRELPRHEDTQQIQSVIVDSRYRRVNSALLRRIYGGRKNNSTNNGIGPHLESHCVVEELIKIFVGGFAIPPKYKWIMNIDEFNN